MSHYNKRNRSNSEGDSWAEALGKGLVPLILVLANIVPRYIPRAYTGFLTDPAEPQKTVLCNYDKGNDAEQAGMRFGMYRQNGRTQLAHVESYTKRTYAGKGRYVNLTYFRMMPAAQSETATWRQQLQPYFSGEQQAPYQMSLSTAKYQWGDDGKLYLSGIRRVKQSTEQRLKEDMALCLYSNRLDIEQAYLPSSSMQFAVERQRVAARA